MFPDAESCYARAYTADHLARHPDQRVTAMRLAPAPRQPTDSWPPVRLRVDLRGAGGGAAEALAYCENLADALYCVLEGDAGAFSLVARGDRKDGAILLSVLRDGIALETASDLVLLEADRGDDRTFLLRPRSCG
jgi:hypothetical protein